MNISLTELIEISHQTHEPSSAVTSTKNNQKVKLLDDSNYLVNSNVPPVVFQFN